MKKTATTWGMIFLLFSQSIPLMGQENSISITEIPATSRKTYNLDEKPSNYVDINSSFNILINKEKLKKSISTGLLKNQTKTDQLITEIANLMEFSVKITTQTASFRNSFQKLAVSRGQEELNVLSDNLKSLAQTEADFESKYLENILFMRNKANALFEAGIEDRSEMFRTLSEEMQGYLNKQLDSVLQQEGVYIQLGAWIITQAGNSSIHLNGFDEYPLGEFYEYPTVSLQLTDSQISELENMNKIFNQNNSSYQEIFLELGKQYGNLLLGVLGPMIDSVQQIQKNIQDLQREFKNSQQGIIDQLKTSETSINDYLGNLQKRLNSYKTENIVERDKIQLLMRFNNDEQQIYTQTLELFTKIEAVITGYSSILKNQSAVTTSLLLRIKNQCTFLLNLKETYFKDLGDGLKTMVYGAEFNSNLLEFTDKVKKLAIDAVPSSTSFSLKYTGKRKPGDQVVIKLSAGTPALKKPNDIETYYLFLLDAEPHINMAVAYNFAWPVSKLNEMPPNGPSYSMLFKFRSRKPLYRNVFDIGIGLNFAIYDFNRDNIPEIAAGICLSMLRDYIMGGWGFNFNANIGYFFVGLRIPVNLGSISFSSPEKF